MENEGNDSPEAGKPTDPLRDSLTLLAEDEHCAPEGAFAGLRDDTQEQD